MTEQQPEQVDVSERIVELEALLQQEQAKTAQQAFTIGDLQDQVAYLKWKLDGADTPLTSLPGPEAQPDPTA